MTAIASFTTICCAARAAAFGAILENASSVLVVAAARSFSFCAISASRCFICASHASVLELSAKPSIESDTSKSVAPNMTSTISEPTPGKRLTAMVTAASASLAQNDISSASLLSCSAAAAFLSLALDNKLL